MNGASRAPPRTQLCSISYGGRLWSLEDLGGQLREQVPSLVDRQAVDSRREIDAVNPGGREVGKAITQRSGISDQRERAHEPESRLPSVFRQLERGSGNVPSRRKLSHPRRIGGRMSRVAVLVHVSSWGRGSEPRCVRAPATRRRRNLCPRPVPARLRVEAADPPNRAGSTETATTYIACSRTVASTRARSGYGRARRQTRRSRVVTRRFSLATQDAPTPRQPSI